MKKFFSLLFCCIALLLLSCNDDKESVSLYKSQGYIKGEISGTRLDGTDFRESFNYNQYRTDEQDIPLSSSYYQVVNTNYSFNITRENPETSSSVTMLFNLEDPADTTPDNPLLYITFRKENKTQIFEFKNLISDPDIPVITNFSFNKSTGNIKGDFVLNSESNTSENPATITGQFDVVVKELIK